MSLELFLAWRSSNSLLRRERKVKITQHKNQEQVTRRILTLYFPLYILLCPSLLYLYSCVLFSESCAARRSSASSIGKREAGSHMTLKIHRTVGIKLTFMLHWTAKYCTALEYIALQCTALHCNTLICIVLLCTVRKWLKLYTTLKYLHRHGKCP